MSRKTLMFVVLIITTIVTFLQKQIGLSIEAGSAAGALGVIGLYLFGEFKNDFARLKTKFGQERKWADPAFWMALIPTLLTMINSELKLNLPTELIAGVLAAIMGILFKKRDTAAKTA